MTKDSKVVSLAQASGSSAPGLKLARPLLKIRQQGIKQLAVLLRGLFDNADDTLFEMADKAGSNSEQNVYFEAMRDLRMKRRVMESKFYKAIDEGFQGLAKAETPEVSLGSVSMDGLSVLQNDELEQSVAVETMVSRVVNRDQGMALTHLTTRIDSLVGRSINQNNNPMGPKLLCESFCVACKELDVEIKVKLIVFKLFEKYVLNQIEKLYVELNHTLVSDGVLPGLSMTPQARKAAVQRRSLDQAPQVASDAAAPGGASAQTEAGEPQAAELHIAQQVFGTLRTLLARSGVTQREPVSGSSAGPASTASQQELMGMLSQLQQSTEQLEPDSAPSQGEVEDVRGALHGLMSNEQRNASLSSVDDDAINLVSMLFEFILDDKNLPESVKALLGRMQIPILKVAVIDKAFFSKGSHPARKLLNEMASAAMGWNDQDSKTQDRLFQKMEQVVFRILREFEDNISIFNECLDDFLGFVVREQRRSELMEQRVRDAEEGRAKSEAARNAVQQALADKMVGLSLPSVVVSLLEDAWSRVMMLIYLKEGDQSPRWIHSLKTVDALIWSVSPINDAEDRKKLLKMVPGLLKQLRLGLTEIAFDSFAMNKLFAELEAIHLSSFKPKQQGNQQEVKSKVANIVAPPLEAPKAAPASPVNSPDNDSALTTVKQVKSSEAAPEIEPVQAVHVRLKGVEPVAPEPEAETVELADDDPSYRLIDSLKVGAWVEFNESEENHFRCKLAAHIKVTGKYIFVNRTGVKVAEKTRNGLAVELRDGGMRLLDDALLFDRALESVIGNLRQMNPNAR
ncbi:DUF1631 domain-containing protein [Aestuariirhabdus sp. Z084]|uniref:DUF1631 domain-containing protein n=1 Tax=Aestuariirhabdus haliotis TaxID=2918751 RepID=UPI00201B3A69|nr:DUF1631 domain-containing protein [Aestuariirhabdus haliotis]MCL6415983.1 DUF1631 domain-containing protein [Aestuariirhabdus haliotis]MCL6419984.1 DUF1631 domain-containing protein [Aestuariirhabdus haliotis]